MENQTQDAVSQDASAPAQAISGYRHLTDAEIAFINQIKAKAEECGQLIEAMRSPEAAADTRWVAIAATHLQQGFMALTRSIAKPTTF